MVGIEQGGRSARTYVTVYMQQLYRIDSTDATKPGRPTATSGFAIVLMNSHQGCCSVCVSTVQMYIAVIACGIHKVALAVVMNTPLHSQKDGANKLLDHRNQLQHLCNMLPQLRQRIAVKLVSPGSKDSTAGSNLDSQAVGTFAQRCNSLRP